MDVNPGDFVEWIASDFIIGQETLYKNGVYMVDRLGRYKFNGVNMFYLTGIKAGPFSWNNKQFLCLTRNKNSPIPVEEIGQSKKEIKEIDWLGSIREASGR